MSSASAQLQVCQMPRSFCRIAGREPYNSALRINSLGNVSAGAAAFGATTCSSHSGALMRSAVSHPWPPLWQSCYLDMKTPPLAGQALAGAENDRKAAKLFGGLEKRGGAGAELLAQGSFLRHGGNQMPLFDVPESADFFRQRRQLDGEVMVGRRQMIAELPQ